MSRGANRTVFNSFCGGNSGLSFYPSTALAPKLPYEITGYPSWPKEAPLRAHSLHPAVTSAVRECRGSETESKVARSGGRGPYPVPLPMGRGTGGHLYIYGVNNFVQDATGRCGKTTRSE